MGTLKNARNGKSILKIPKWPSLKPLPLKSKFIQQFEISENFCKMLLESKVLLSNKTLFFNNLNRHKISSFNARGLKPGHLSIYDMLFPFLSFFKL